MDDVELNYHTLEKGYVAIWDVDLNYPTKRYKISTLQDIPKCLRKYRKTFIL